ncbi:MAG: hypothetical protein QIT40_gp23 [Lokiarchaeia virus VerdaV4]|uniref:Uncharacterized protein n=1 Tax=Lokiarchaeia virus VerdaV4 TaxID=3070172 RepID=A0AA35G9T3_9CAUD|nr:MAG: hypothetical protein QIT40_gp23 [Lokiarchaeia virus VerdaV4]BDI54981.1 MAG: hypothetical protein [Lokiarchaeia virus VerdaV4]
MKSLDEELDEALGLSHPRAPIISETGGLVEATAVPNSNTQEVRTPPSKPIIDFSYLTNNSSFQRAIMEFIKKFVPGFKNVNPRGSKVEMAKSFDQNAQNYSAVMNEFKLKLERLKNEVL